MLSSIPEMSDYVDLDIKLNTSGDNAKEILIALLDNADFEAFKENDEGLNAYIPASSFDENVVFKIIEHFKTLFKKSILSYNINIIKEQNWNSIWEKNFEPIIINDKCIVRAPFHNQNKKYPFEIIIEPKMSFGTGHHQTTSLMITGILNMDLEGKRVLDIGCGTGILAILSSMKGAAKVVAVDIDEWAYNNTLENIALNKQDKIKVYLTDGVKLTNEKFDVILANINRNVIMKNLPKYIKILKPKGTMMFCGFYKADLRDIINTASGNGLVTYDCEEKNDWVRLTCKIGVGSNTRKL